MTMSDDELRAALKRAHAEDRTPPFETLARGPARRRRRVAPLVLLPVAALLVVVLLLVVRRAPPSRSPSPAPPSLAALELHNPLAFLLAPPSPTVFGAVPRFETKGARP